MKKLLAGIAMVGLMALGAGQAWAETAKFDTIEATRIVLKDGQGKDRIVLEVAPTGAAMIRVLAREGDTMATLAAQNGTATLFLFGSDSSGEAAGMGLSQDTYLPMNGRMAAIEATAYMNSEGYLTDSLIRTSCKVYYRVDTVGETFVTSFEAYVDTKTQPGWSVYTGNGRFSVSDREVRNAYQEAGASIEKSLLQFLDTKGIKVNFSVNGSAVGTYTEGKMTLKGE